MSKTFKLCIIILALVAFGISDSKQRVNRIILIHAVPEDVEYTKPTVEQMCHAIIYAHKCMKLLEIGSYQKESRDCDNYAYMTWAFMQEWWAKNGNKDTGMAVFMPSYKLKEDNYHIIIECQTDNGFVFYIEPQNIQKGKIPFIKLNAEQIRSIRYRLG